MRVHLPERLKQGCLACGTDTALTDEHVISRTVRKQIPLLGKVRETVGRDVRPEVDVLNMVVADCVCHPCNDVWMGDLEDDFVARLGECLTQPLYITLNPSDQERIAMWVIKTAIMIEVYMECCQDVASAHIPFDNLRWMATNVSPPPNSKAWMFSFDSGQKRLGWSRGGTIGDHRGNPIGALMTFTVANLGFQALVFDSTDPVTREVAEPPASLEPPPPFSFPLVPLWPASETEVRFPGAAKVDDSERNLIAGWHTYLMPPVSPTTDS